MIVENQPQLSIEVLDKCKQIISTILKEKGKEEVQEIDLDEDIVIPNWDISTLIPDQMDTMGELLKKRPKQSKIIEEKKKENQILVDINKIFVDALSIEVDGKKTHSR